VVGQHGVYSVKLIGQDLSRYSNEIELEMWANAERDGRPVEYRWRRETRWNVLGWNQMTLYAAHSSNYSDRLHGVKWMYFRQTVPAISDFAPSICAKVHMKFHCRRGCQLSTGQYEKLEIRDFYQNHEIRWKCRTKKFRLPGKWVTIYDTN